ncbi:MAG: WD40 repeat domain-containing protein [Richelia sp. RM2_1_2]|nr:WD40 repeat domain-containing protein [Richelia sp. RM1_1_1]NJO30275.1 WD40 repeat domain-containing protein [Richelia sp. SL_2_1]NJO64094.1 WD40 repeat domain-containing protein [Richelia sp. RM2_1_2]
MYKKSLKLFTSVAVSAILSIVLINSNTSASTLVTEKNTDAKHSSVENIKQLKNQAPDKKILVAPGQWKIARSVAVSRDGQIIVSGDDEGKVQFWSRDTGKLIRTLSAHSNWVQSIAIAKRCCKQIAPDDQTIASGSVDGTIKFWNRNGELKNTLRNVKPVYAIVWSPDGQILASGDGDGRVSLWNRNGKLIRSIKAHSGNVVSVAITPNDKIIASRSFGDEQIKLWDLNTGKLIRSIAAGSVGGVNSLAVSPDGKKLAGYFNDETVKIWLLETGETVETLDIGINRPHAIAFSPDSKTLAVGGFGSEIQIWSMSTSEKLSSLFSPDHTYSLTFAPDSKTLVASGGQNGGSLTIWSLNESTSNSGSRGFNLTFDKQKISTVVSNSVIRGERDKYYFNAQPGQWTSIAIASIENNAVFQLSYKQGGIWREVPGTEEGKDTRVWHGKLPKSESNSYQISVGGSRGNATYDLFVGISAVNY